MAKKGRAAQALATAAIGSFVAGTIGTLLVAFFTPTIATWAVEMGAPTYFAMMLLAMVMVSCGSRGVQAAGIPVGLGIGLTIGLVGLDALHGAGAAHGRLGWSWPTASTSWWSRSASSRSARQWGGPLHLRRMPISVIPVGRPFMGRDDWGRSWAPWLRGTAIGFPSVPCPPAVFEGGTVLSYVPERETGSEAWWGGSGEGAIEGVAGPEAANNASAAGMFVPLLALGLPVTATASILLAAMQKVRHRARADPDDRPARADLDAAGQPADRQHPVAGHQPAARADLGQAAPRPATAALRRHPLLRLPLLGAYSVTVSLFDLQPCCWSSGAWASRPVGSASRCCH